MEVEMKQQGWTWGFLERAAQDRNKWRDLVVLPSIEKRLIIKDLINVELHKFRIKSVGLAINVHTKT